MRGERPTVWCEHLVKLYDSDAGPVQAVRGVDLELEAGAIVAIAGPSGCGKSSLLRVLAGLDAPTAGFVHLDGRDLYRLSPRARAAARAAIVTHVHQRPGDNLLDHLTVAQQLERIAGTGEREGKSVTDTLAILGLDDVRDRLPRHLSGGERQRVAVGRALASGHRVVIADEPTSQLDSDNTTAVVDALETLCERGSTVIVATHDARVLERVDQIVTMRDGAVASITEQGAAFAVIDRSGRVQLPPEAHRRFDRRARLSFDPTTGRVVLDQP
jgi:putative ABC transport system ATP-binding protein